MRTITDFGDRSVLIARSVSWSADSRHLFAAVAEVDTDIVLFDGLIDVSKRVVLRRAGGPSGCFGVRGNWDRAI